MYTRKNIDDLDYLRKDIERAVQIWTEILEPHVEYAYFKGSAAKSIETRIDYVPEVSDLDIHIKGDFLRRGTKGIEQALRISAEYEELFTRGQYWHMPRSQLIEMSDMETLMGYYRPLQKDVRVMIGDPKLPERIEDTGISIDEHRRIDRERSKDTAQFLDTFRYSIVDKTSLDLWAGLRKMNWRISPSVCRLLSQTENPFEIWGMNRTSVLKILKIKFPELAELFSLYYRSAWELYEDHFQSAEKYRRTISLGCQLLNKSMICISEFY